VPQLTKNREYCSIARALEVLGERWTLLIVRDLLTGPKRFSELGRLVVGITPKWLTARLRALEDARLVRRDGRAYLLTEQGEGLRTVLEELSLWAGTFESRPPRADEVIIAEHDMWALEVFLNRNAVEWPRPVVWAIELTDAGTHSFTFDGTSWTWAPQPVDSPDLRIVTTARSWSTLLANAQVSKATSTDEFEITGRAHDVRALKNLANLVRV
jgi:DNA-binding HxlR family transcriptional regulator